MELSLSGICIFLILEFFKTGICFPLWWENQMQWNYKYIKFKTRHVVGLQWGLKEMVQCPQHRFRHMVSNACSCQVPPVIMADNSCAHWRSRFLSWVSGKCVNLFGLGEFISKIRMSDYFLNEMATHSSIPAWRIPWLRSLGGYSPRGLKSQTWLSS